jgi:hypothetical protein
LNLLWLFPCCLFVLGVKFLLFLIYNLAILIAGFIYDMNR